MPEISNRKIGDEMNLKINHIVNELIMGMIKVGRVCEYTVGACVYLCGYLWLYTLFPAMKMFLPVPRTENIRRATSTFSTPWSPRTLERWLWNLWGMKFLIYCNGRFKAIGEVTYMTIWDIVYSEYINLNVQDLPLWKAMLLNSFTEEGKGCAGLVVVANPKIRNLWK